MRVEVLALCDAATTHAGKLNILGFFDTIYAREIPVMHPACAIAVRLRWERIEANEQHRIRLQFVDEDGHEVMPTWEGAIHVQSLPDRSSVVTDLTLNLQHVQFKVYGQYAVDLAIDGRLEASLPLYVLPVPVAVEK
ncbi:MAG: hypothetical protein KF893_17800 [Caldilineaceae bacterium]|nr:hypothetical protein [Caldilineaceae bacterium]